MISDSPYDSGELALRPWFGVAAGVIGALLMLLMLQAAAPASQLSPGDALARIGSVVTRTDATQNSALIAGLALHLGVSGLLGLLYALSQRRIPYRGLIGVGLLFGFVIWIISSLIIGQLLDTSLREALRSWPWLLANLLYGLVLAITAVYQESRRSQQKQPVAVRD